MGKIVQQHYTPIPGYSDVANIGKKGILSGIIGGLGSAFLGPAGPILGSLASGAINFGLNRIESGIQNRYNSPKRTVQRLQEAGMPAAAYLEGGGNKSAESSGSYVNPDLGTAEAISREQVNRMQKQQFQLMQREMELKEAQQRLAEANAYKSEIWGDYMGRTPGDYSVSNFGNFIQTQNNLREAQVFYTNNKSEFQDLNNQVYKALKDKGIQVAMEEGKLKVIEEQPDLMKAREALMSQQIQESVSRIARNMVAMDAMRTQMSVAEQTMSMRRYEDMFNNMLLYNMNENDPLGSAINNLFFYKGKGVSVPSINPNK